MAGAYALLFAAMISVIAGAYSLWSGNMLGTAFVAFGLILFLLGIRQLMANRKGDE